MLIALFSVLRVNPNFQITSHIPTGSDLREAILHQQTFLLPGHQLNLLCGAAQSGRQIEATAAQRAEIAKNPNEFVVPPLNCGTGIPDRIPYYLMLVAMVATTYFQQRQMQRASPVGSQQQQAITRIMPFLFVFFGYLYAAGLVLYWTTTNLFQIGQQAFMLRRGLIGTPAAGGAKALGDGTAKPERPKGTSEPRQDKQQRPGGEPRGEGQPSGGDGSRGSPQAGKPAGRDPASKDPGRGGSDGAGRGQSSRSGGTPGGQRRGGSNAGSRKKRRKR